MDANANTANNTLPHRLADAQDLSGTALLTVGSERPEMLRSLTESIHPNHVRGLDNGDIFEGPSWSSTSFGSDKSVPAPCPLPLAACCPLYVVPAAFGWQRVWR
jgi:hypothetical protein